MEFKLTRETLENDALYETLKALYDVFDKLGIDIYVVGALARDISMKRLKVEASRRETTDLDVAVALADWNQYDMVKDELLKNHFKKDPGKQKFWYKGPTGDNDYEVDLVPFGEVAVDEKICWPPEGNPVMSVKCFKDVMSVAETISVDDIFKFKTATLAGQFLIKLDTWNDRHLKTNKDAVDMFYIMDNYYMANITEKEPIPEEVQIIGEDFETIVWGAKWIACEIKTFLSAEHLRDYLELIRNELEKEERSPLITDLMEGDVHNKNRDDSKLSYDIVRKCLISMVEILEK